MSLIDPSEILRINIRIAERLGYTSTGVILDTSGANLPQALQAKKKVQNYLEATGQEARFIGHDERYLVFSRRTTKTFK